MASASSTLAGAGTLEIVSGNTPFLLNDSDAAWRVESGRVEIFSVSVENGEAAGSRFHFLTVEPGMIFSGMNLAAEEMGHGFLAVGMVETRLRRFSLREVENAIAQSDDGSEEWLRSLDRWIEAVSRAAARNHHGRTELLLEAGPAPAQLSGKSFRAREGTLWMRRPKGLMLFASMEELAEGRSFPLTSHAPVEALNDAEFSLATTAEMAREGELASGLASLFDAVLKCEAANKRFLEVDFFNRRRDRLQSNQRAGTAALNRLATILSSDRPASDSAISNALFLTCKVVADAAGFEAVPPAEMLKNLELDNPLEAIARSSGARIRKVALDGQWWTKNSGPLLGYNQNNEPVALIPSPHGSYEAVNPAKGTREMLSEANGGSYAKEAIQFYRPFPAQALDFLKILRFGLKSTKKELSWIAGMGAAAGLLSLLFPIAAAMLIDTVIPEASRSHLAQLVAALFFLAAGIACFDFVRGMALLRLEGKMDLHIQSAVIDRLLKLPLGFFRNYTAGDLAERANGITKIREILSQTVASTLIANIFGLFQLGLLFYYDATLAVIAIALIAGALGVMASAFVMQVARQRRITALQGKISGMALQFFTGISKLRVAAAEGLAFAAWAGVFADQKREALRSRRVVNFAASFNAAFPIVATGVIFWVISSGLLSSQFTPGTFVAFTTAFGSFLAAMIATLSSLIIVLNVVPLFERVRPILRELPEISEARLSPGELNGAVELSGVCFRYFKDSPLVLNNVSLRIEPGEFVAFVGPSGSGKSTLLRLLLGFERPETGAIHYDGKSIMDMDTSALRRKIGSVLQTSRLIPGSILSNISGPSQLNEEEAWEAARVAGAEDFIRDLPMGMHTMIPAGGATFSGGQQQRLMIARAVASKPRILLFDEATSALDNRTQAAVSDRVEKLHATRIVIAHRLSTIINADRIYVMRNGRVEQTGNYRELMAAPGLFREMAERQMVEPETETA